jgi:hypothetical protein
VRVRAAPLSGRRIDLDRTVEAADPARPADFHVLPVRDQPGPARRVDRRRFDRIGRDEVVIQDVVVELDDLVVISTPITRATMYAWSPAGALPVPDSQIFPSGPR